MTFSGLLLLAMTIAAQADKKPAPNVASLLTEKGVCAVAGESPDVRVEGLKLIAPGDPPILAFRFYEGKEHHRFGNSELLLDDAGH